MHIDDLDLAEPAMRAARLLAARHPKITFTSGRRRVADQARAMASNIRLNRRWIAETYRRTAERDMLQTWVDAHPRATSAAAIAAGLRGVMARWSDDQRARLSRHFSGQAFDVQPLPPGPEARAVKATIRALPGLTKFLEQEGGLIRWHAEFA